jgi:hypothetical protein
MDYEAIFLIIRGIFSQCVQIKGRLEIQVPDDVFGRRNGL